MKKKKKKKKTKTTIQRNGSTIGSKEDGKTANVLGRNICIINKPLIFTDSSLSALFFPAAETD